MMAHPVFISYARRSTAEYAKELHEALGGDDGLAFLDTSDLDHGDVFPRILADGVLDARVVVVFADDQYFSRWYCLRELRTALAPCNVVRQRYTSNKSLNQALSHVVIALPSGSVASGFLGLPPQIKIINWPAIGQTTQIAGLVKQRLQEVSRSIREDLDALDANYLIETLCEEAALSPPGNLSNIRLCDPSDGVRWSISEKFVGRSDELARIDFLLSTMRGQPDQCAASALRVSAAGGYGKTRLVSEYLHRYGPLHYPGGLFWIDASVDAAGIEEQHYAFLCNLKSGPCPALATMREQKVNMREFLAEVLRQMNPGSPVLVIIDNIPENTPGKPAHSVSEYCPAIGSVTILATSRQRTSEAGVMEMTLDILPRPASILLLTSDLENRNELNMEEWGAIADWVGDLPLALDLLNKALLFNAITPRDLLARSARNSVTQELDIHKKSLQSQLAENAVRGAVEAFSISYERLDPQAKAAAAVIAQFSSAAVPEALMQALEPEMNTPGVRAALHGRHFVTGHSAGLFGRMHPVLADYIRTSSDSSDCGAVILAGKALLRGAPSESVFAPLELPYVMSAYRKHAEFTFHKLKALTDPTGRLLAGDLALWIAEICSWQHDSRGAKRFAGECYHIRTQIDGNDAPETLTAMQGFGSALHSNGDYAAAREIQEQVIKILQASERPDYPDILAAKLALASTLSDEGDFDSARNIEEEVLQRLQGQSNIDESDVLDCKAQLAWTMFEQGQFTASRELLEQVIERRRSLGEDDLEMRRLFNNLAQVYRLQGKLQEAREILEPLVRGISQLWGDEHFETLAAKHNLASLLERLGRFEEAHRLVEETINGLERLLGSAHPKTLSAKNMLGNVFMQTGDVSSARKQHEAVLLERIRVLGPQHPDTLISMNNLASALAADGDVAKGLEMLQTMLEIQERVLGKEHPEFLNSRANMAMRLSEPAAKQQALERCLTDERRILGKDHPYTLGTMNNLAFCLSENGDLDGARELFEELNESGVRVLGSQHPHILSSLNALLDLMCKQNDFIKAYQLSRRSWGEEHPTTIDLAEIASGFLVSQNTDLSTVRSLLEFVLEKRITALGRTHPDTLRAAKKLTALLRMRHDWRGLQGLQERIRTND